MALRASSILALAVLLAAASGGGAFAESKAKAMVDKSPAPAELTLRCRRDDGTAKLLCAESRLVRTGKRLVEPEPMLATSLSLYTARNLATKESATKLLRGVTGSPTLARKAAPTLLRLTKSAPARYGLAIAVLSSGAIAVYERLYGDDTSAAARPVGGGATYVAHRKLGEFDSQGNFSATLQDKKP